jgi:hypothetical protein
MYLVRHGGNVDYVTATADFRGWTHYIRITKEVWADENERAEIREIQQASDRQKDRLLTGKGPVIST